jgi:S-DNA-T family DNA segregation ATPase FtsK/SpoIIIE
VNFGDPLTPHLLTAGTTGSGKTNAQRLFIYDLAGQNEPGDLRLLLIDTRKRGRGWRPFASLPHLLHPIVTEDGEALRALAWAVAEMDRRAANGRTRPHIFVGMDEAQALLDREEFVKPIGDLAAVGREFGLHLLLATQNPTKEQLGSTAIKRNVTTRLVGKVDSAQAAIVAAGIKESGAELLTGPGDQLLIQPTGVRRVTTALVTEQDTARLPGGEEIARLDLGEYEDVDHVLEQAGARSKAAPLEPEHVACALASGKGIGYLKNELSIGSARATRLKEFAAAILASLEFDYQHTVVPLQNPASVPASHLSQ